MVRPACRLIAAVAAGRVRRVKPTSPAGRNSSRCVLPSLALGARRESQWLLASALAIGSACSGRAQSAGSGPAAAQSAAELAASTHKAQPESVSPPEALRKQAAETRLARLTHSQYANTVVDLLGLAEPPELTFAPDARNSFGFDTSSGLQVDARLGPQYRATAEALASRVVEDPALMRRLLPCDPQASGCRDEFIRGFGERAFRRPLAPDDVDTYRALFDSAAQPTDAGLERRFRSGVRLTLEAMLQSPDFLYRKSPTLAQEVGGRVPLDDFAVASRLSYFLYDSMPDEALLEAARAEQLHTPEQVEQAARRMLRSSRVVDKLVAFHQQAWHFERFARISPDAKSFERLPAALVPRVSHSARLFVREVLRRGGGLEELLTAPYAYVDSELAPLYGVAGPPAGRFERVDFELGQRKGLLMQIGFLAANAYSVDTDPIHRGLFVVRDLLCREMPDPPPGASDRPPPATDQPIVTTRDEVSLVTGQSFCPVCHKEINPPGFAFEGFDAVGRVRATDNGAPVDTTSAMVLDGEWVRFQGPGELVELLAQSREAHQCYTRRWLEFAYGRPLAESDAAALAELSRNSLPLADLIVGIVQSPQFLSLPLPNPPADPKEQAVPAPRQASRAGLTAATSLTPNAQRGIQP